MTDGSRRAKRNYSSTNGFLGLLQNLEYGAVMAMAISYNW